MSPVSVFPCVYTLIGLSAVFTLSDISKKVVLYFCVSSRSYEPRMRTSPIGSSVRCDLFPASFHNFAPTSEIYVYWDTVQEKLIR
jgi:hypothetical protein